MPQLVTDAENATSKSRLVGIRLAALSLRLRENWARLFGDADTAAIALAIVVIISERLMRVELDAELESLSVPMPTEALARCNISSIAAATGFNRETTRRKVDQLVKAGMVIKERSIIRLAPGFTQQEIAIEVVKAQLDEVRRAANDLLRLGVISVAENVDSPRPLSTI